jgi:hypothetical protein
MTNSTEETTPADAEGTETDRTPDEGNVSDATPVVDATDPEGSDSESEPDTFPREVVEKLRHENGKYRQRAQQSDALAQRLHTELVRATGRLADPTDLPFNSEHLDDPDALAAAVDELLAQKPHLASRRPVGDIGQGQRGGSSQPFSLLEMLKDRT